jgi:hypothetical protein
MEHGMLVLGAAANSAWELLSSLQAQQMANAGAAAGGIGAGQFAAEDASGQELPASAPQFALPATGTTAQTALSPEVLGFLIWNQSQQAGGTAGSTGTAATTSAGTAAATTGTAGGTDTAAGTPLQSLFSLFAADGDGTAGKFAPDSAFGADGKAAAGPAPSNQINPSGDAAIAPGELGTATPSSGAHGHHHHHAAFAGQSQSGQSDPLTSLLGTSADGASSATATNADGSTTTTITYADGSEVTLTMPAQASNASGTTTATAAATQPPASYNILETLIQLQAQLLAPTAAA